MLTFVHPRLTGAIEVTKTRKQAAAGSGDHPFAGVEFTVDGGTAQTTDADGKTCFDGLEMGEYTVHENVPGGYAGVDDQVIDVDTASTCADDPFAGNTAEFSNTP